MRATLDQGGITIEVPVANANTSSLEATLKLELLEPSDFVAAKSEVKARLRAGMNFLTVRIEKPGADRGRTKDALLWSRIRYRLLTGNGAESSLQGLVTLGAIARDLFDLRIVHQPYAMEGETYQVLVHAANPVTRRPVPDVEVRGALSLGDDSEADSMPLVRKTNAAGDAILAYGIPKTVDSSDGELKIEARKGGQLRQEEIDVDLIPFGGIILNTDKRLYQPGQSLHARALVFDWNRHVLAQAAVQFTLQDPEDQIVFRESAGTDQFGIAHADWQLPDSLRLGDYVLELEILDSDRYDNFKDRTTIRVSRYELPNFTVSAKLDRPYYLPDQNASVEISADYLFGKPVTHGSVRLVRETERSWNYKEQKWELEESDTQSAELDSSGHTRLQLDLAALHADFREETYSRYRDITYAALVTDSTTGKTEPRRFKLRLSRDPIHIYLAGAHSDGEAADFYVTTFYPDGTPASCQVQISQLPESRGEAKPEKSQLLRSIRTNRYGAAKVTGLRLLQGDEYENGKLLLEARDKARAYTRYEDNLWSSSRSIAVNTDKTLYADGDPVIVSVRALGLSGNLNVDIVKHGAALRSSRIRLRRGRGFTTFPYQPQFRGELTVVAYSLDTAVESRYDTPVGGHTILYPHNTELKVQIRPDRQVYKPGEEFSARLDVRSPSGLLEASAIGITVVDKAVDERARTDQEFGFGRFGFWDWSWWYDTTNIGGVSEESLDKLDLSQPLPEGLDLAAEVLLNSRGISGTPSFEESDYETRTEYLFKDRIQAQLKGLLASLHNESLPGWKFPANNKELADLCEKSAVDLKTLTDPWDVPYVFEFDVVGRNRIVRVISSGPDKTIDTVDDIRAATDSWSYFAAIGAAIDRAVKDTYARSGGFIRDLESLQGEVRRQGIDIGTLLDPWGSQYRFDFQVNERFWQINVLSRGPAKSATDRKEEFSVWTSNIDYFSTASKKIDAALAQYGMRTGRFPRDDQEFDRVAKEAGFDFRGLRDPWGNAYSVTYVRSARYADSQTIVYEPGESQQNSKPVTRKLDWVNIWSRGPDGKLATRDDVALAGFSRIVSEQSGADKIPQPVVSAPLAESTGAIGGTVIDPSGAVLPSAQVTAKRESSPNEEYSAKTNNDGNYLLRNLKPGSYSVVITSPGFRSLTVAQVPVHSSSVTTVNATLQLGSMTETVSVQAQAFQVNTSTSSMARSRTVEMPGKAQVQEQTMTPRLRDYFPETLYWEPSLITDRAGQAKINFKLADNITTWKMSVLASTKNGEIGAADAEIQAFQPFFVDHDPPKILTVGDEIDLPVVIRNYLPQVQKVGVEMKPADWFSIERAGKQQVAVPAGDSAVAVFPFRALAAAKAGKQTIVAANRTVGDAIEKTVNIHPDGREESRVKTELLRGSGALDLELPRDFIAGSVQAEIKIYPNLLAHVVEGIEGNLQRPYGCGEQTISSTYPGVLILKQSRGGHTIDNALAQRAERYARMGYARLLNYRAPSGGFNYWGRGEADTALTAYAVRFLMDTSGLLDVDQDSIAASVKWLISQQQKDGGWAPRYGGDQGLTAYVTHILASYEKQLPAGPLKTQVHEAVQKGLNQVAVRRDLGQEPYTLALYALAAWDSGNREGATEIASKLRHLARHEGSGTYWALETNTPFYGWGDAGRLESTAMVVRAISEIDGQSKESAQVVGSGITFLLKQKDKYGVWYSGQATVNVLETLLGVLGGSESGLGGKASVVINGQKASECDLPPSAAASGPLMADISSQMRPGDNRIEVQMNGKSEYSSAQVVVRYFVPWRAGPGLREDVQTGESRALRLAVQFDKTEVRAGEEVQCTVDAERIGHHGYGMMLAEVGVPPGSDVDRASIERAMESQGWTISRYDLLPDRLVFYLWPSAGGSKFTFSFRPRFPLKARTAPSMLYDYYNPEAQLVLSPTSFHVLPNPDDATAGQLEGGTDQSYEAR